MMTMPFEACVLWIIFISELNEFLSGGRTSDAQLKVANEHKIVGLRITLFKVKCWFKSESRPFLMKSSLLTLNFGKSRFFVPIRKIPTIYRFYPVQS